MEDYKVSWWKLFNAGDATGWTNVLAIIELLFCLPMANGRFERMFSQFELLKNDRQTALGKTPMIGCFESMWKDPLSWTGMQMVHSTYG